METVIADYSQIERKVRDTLRRHFGPNIAIQTDQGETGHVFVKVVSDRFDGISERQKQEEIWDVLRHDLQEEAQRVGLVLAFGMDQI